jgi:hypothetical protein
MKFDDLISVPLQSAVNDIMKTQSSAKSYILENSVLGISFFTLENNIIMLYNRRVTIRPDDYNIKFERHQCPGNDCPPIARVVVGHLNSRERVFWEQRDLSGNLENFARTFVQEQIDKHLSDIGPPIDIVRITAHGVEWVQRKPECL